MASTPTAHMHSTCEHPWYAVAAAVVDNTHWTKGCKRWLKVEQHMKQNGFLCCWCGRGSTKCCPSAAGALSVNHSVDSRVLAHLMPSIAAQGCRAR